MIGGLTIPSAGIQKIVETSAGIAPSGRDKALYYALGLTPPVRHADWVRRDVGSTSWHIRRAIQWTVGALLGVLIATLLFGPRPALIAGTIIGSIIGFIIQLTLMQDYVRRRTLDYYEKRWNKQRSE